MVDIFEEVEEQLRSARYRTLALSALPYLAGSLVLALLIALGGWAYSSHRASVDAKASEAYASGLDHAQSGDTARAFGEFGQVAKSGAKGYGALALMQQGAIRLKDNKIQEAVALFDQAADRAPTPLIGDAARLQAVYVLMGANNLVEINGRLKPLLAEGGPYRAQAQEALGLSKLANGKAADARGDFVVLTQGLDTPEGIRQRAQAAIALIDGGGAADIPAILKAAKALPAPPVSASPAAPPSTPPQAGAGQ